MTQWLKKSTAGQVINFGPFVDKTDGVTLVTSLVSALDNGSTGIMVSKNGGTLAVRHATVTATTYDAHGCYKVTLDATDTDTLGRLRVMYTSAATCLPVWVDFTVVPANVYESLITGVEWLETTSLKPDWSIASTTLTVKAQNDSTTQFTKTITATPGADPITGLA